MMMTVAPGPNGMEKMAIRRHTIVMPAHRCRQRCQRYETTGSQNYPRISVLSLRIDGPTSNRIAAMIVSDCFMPPQFVNRRVVHTAEICWFVVRAWWYGLAWLGSARLDVNDGIGSGWAGAQCGNATNMCATLAHNNHSNNFLCKKSSRMNLFKSIRLQRVSTECVFLRQTECRKSMYV